jgi:fucose 4-O-acetylase-like acetyltransferase
MRGVGPFSPGQKLFMTIGTSLLTLAAIVQFIMHLASGSEDWPYYALAVVVCATMIVMVRRTAIIGQRR